MTTATEPVETMDTRVTTSQIAKYQTCARAHYWAYIRRLRRAESSDALRIGSAVHAFLDEIRRGADFEATISTIREKVVAGFADTTTARYEAAKVEALLRVHHWRWQNGTLPVMQSEGKFAVPIINPETGHSSRTFLLAGRIDAIMQAEDGVYIYETKTTSEAVDGASDYWTRLQIDRQISNYWLAAKHLGIPVVGVLYDVIRKPLHQPSWIPASRVEDLLGPDMFGTGGKYTDAEGETISHGHIYKDGMLDGEPIEIEELKKGRRARETPALFRNRLMHILQANHEQYFARQIIRRSEEDLKEAAQDLWDITQSMLWSWRNNRWPRNPSACRMYGAPCPYLGFCADRDPRLDSPSFIPEGFRIASSAHEELDEEEG